MNDTNNNLNGTVLGNVNNTEVNNNPMPNETVEVLDTGFDTLASNQVMDNNGVVNNEVQPQSTFFTNPPVNNQEQNTEPVNNQSQVLDQPTPQLEPTPAYTSVQSINPTPMPGFENSGTIGTTPPISLEPEKQPKKKSNKIIFIILVLIVLAGVGFGTYYVLNYTDLLNKEEEVTIKTKDFEINIGETLSDNISDFATITGTDSKNCSLDKTEVNSNVAGEYTYKITCGNNSKEGKITIVDNTELAVNTKAVYKVSGDTIEAVEFIDEPNSEYTYEFVESETVQTNLATEGTYVVRIKATSKTGKTLEVDAKLIVLQYAIKGYLTCSSNGQNITDSSAVMTISNKFAIAKDNNNQSIYGKVAFETYTFKYSDETEYANLLATYKSEGKITINNISGTTEFDDTNLTITISNEKDNTDIYNEYGEANFAKFSTIKSYFESTKGYKCTYKNEND